MDSGLPSGEPALYMSLTEHKVIDGGVDGMVENYIRPRMAKDQPQWKSYVTEKAKEFYAAQENK